MGIEKVTLENTKEYVYVHTEDMCEGEVCYIHNRTDHHMRSYPQHWRDDRWIMERICPHGIGHPDPDDPTEDRMHKCDGCCRPDGLWVGKEMPK